MFRGLVSLVLDESGVLLTCQGVGTGGNDCATKASGGGVASVKDRAPSSIMGEIEFVIAKDRRNCEPGPMEQGSVPGPGKGAHPLKVPYV